MEPVGSASCDCGVSCQCRVVTDYITHADLAQTNCDGIWALCRSCVEGVSFDCCSPIAVRAFVPAWVYDGRNRTAYACSATKIAAPLRGNCPSIP